MGGGQLLKAGAADKAQAGTAPSRARVSVAALYYRPRIAGYLFMAAMLASIPADERFAQRLALILLCLVWPHLAYWLAQRRGGGRRTETVNIVVDFFLGGLLVMGYAFRLWPTTAMLAMGVINAMMNGGPRLLLIALAASGAVPVAAWLLVGVDPHWSTEPAGTAISIIAILSYVVVVGALARRLQLDQRRTRSALEQEERKSQELLSNILPQSVVPRLRAGESPIADQFADVTVVFADIVEFTPLAERLGPKRTVLLLNDLFARFDQAAARLGVEKIETTGDGYLAVAGAPETLDHHAEAVAGFALEVLAACRETSLPEGSHVQVRVGIHTGPIFAGVIGKSRFHYKIFGETVNTASRVQSHALQGRILVSESTYKRLRGKFMLEEHGVVDLKGHGPMRTYWLVSPVRDSR